MTLCAFIGDELTAAGLRLAGVAVYHPPSTEAPALFERLCGEVSLILLTTEMARHLPSGRLQQVQMAGQPLVLVIPDVRQRASAPDLIAAVRRQLGLAE